MNRECVVKDVLQITAAGRPLLLGSAGRRIEQACRAPGAAAAAGCIHPNILTGSTLPGNGIRLTG